MSWGARMEVIRRYSTLGQHEAERLQYLWHTSRDLLQTSRTHRQNPDAKQVCCMWSTDDPPDISKGQAHLRH